MKVLFLFMNFLNAASIGHQLSFDFLKSLTLPTEPSLFHSAGSSVSKRSARRRSLAVQHQDKDALAFVKNLTKRTHVFYFK
jgi:hypothetical protein